MTRPAPFVRETVEVPCTIDLERTGESFHAHAVPEGIELRPGDVVLVHDAPRGIAFGERLTYASRATVTRAGWLARAWTRLIALRELPELYEVGFQPKEMP